jgi:hypothetical protein
MDWIKRNLFFVVGAAVALLLMALAGYYTWSGYSENSAQLEKLNAIYEESKQLAEKKPHPGDARTDNISAAKAQQKELQALLARLGQHLQRIPAIPAGGSNVTSQEFASELRSTLRFLQRDATNNSVFLPVVTGGFAYSFTAQSQLIKFAPGSLEPLAVQLGEVKAICTVLHSAKVNALDSVRRERVSADDSAGVITDYHDQLSTTNDLAILTPYEVTFRCYTPELAEVLKGMAVSPYGLVVKAINVEPAVSVTLMDATGMTPVYAQPIYAQPPPVPMHRSPLGEEGMSPAMASRYNRGPLPGMQPAPVAVAPAAATRPGLKTILNEKQIKVTMLIHVVKLLPKT